MSIADFQHCQSALSIPPQPGDVQSHGVTSMRRWLISHSNREALEIKDPVSPLQVKREVICLAIHGAGKHTIAIFQLTSLSV